jgi:hypothetical protein
MMRLWERIPLFWRYTAIILLASAISASGVVWAATIENPKAGSWGGAIAAILALIVILLRPDYGIRMYDHHVQFIDSKLPPIDQVDEKHTALVRAWRLNSAGQAHQNKALVIASIIGTIFCGFGEAFTNCLIQSQWFQRHH